MRKNADQNNSKYGNFYAATYGKPLFITFWILKSSLNSVVPLEKHQVSKATQISDYWKESTFFFLKSKLGKTVTIENYCISFSEKQIT